MLPSYNRIVLVLERQQKWQNVHVRQMEEGSMGIVPKPDGKDGVGVGLGAGAGAGAGAGLGVVVVGAGLEVVGAGVGGAGAGAAGALPRSLELMTLSSSGGELRSKATCAAAFCRAALTSEAEAALRYCSATTVRQTSQHMSKACI